MEKDIFRVNHSKLVEEYQFIEHHLEGLYAILEDGEFLQLANRVENDTMGELIRKVKYVIKEKKLSLISKNDFAILDEIRNDRNFWCHQCFLDIKEDPEKLTDITNRLVKDLEKTTQMNKLLRDAFQKMM